MKKIDKLILEAFIGPFLITFLVVVFILLNINMLKYFDDIIGKGLGWTVLGQLFFYFAIFTVPTAMPLAVLLSSLIAFGNLGEHFELTAVKSAGISLLRILRPIFFFVLFLTAAAFYANNNLVPKAALEAYSLLYDIKQKKPALELREGTFYRGIDNLSIKVNQKFPDDEEALKGVIVYDHRKNDGNKEVTIADSGRMYTILNERYLKFELFDGYNYIEGAANEREITGKRALDNESISRSKFSKTQVVFDLSSFQLQTTDKKWFQGNRIMRNLSQLDMDMDSLDSEVLDQRLGYYLQKPAYFGFYMRNDSLVMPPEVYTRKLFRDSLSKVKQMDPDQARINEPSVRGKGNRPDSAARRSATAPTKPEQRVPVAVAEKKRINDQKLAALKSPVQPEGKTKKLREFDAQQLSKIDSIFRRPVTLDDLSGAANAARQIKSQIQNSNGNIEAYEKEYIVFEIQWHKIIASSFACIAMFLIGAPLGAIIKKGGLGVPVLVSILFFIVYYIVTMQGEKLAKQGSVSVEIGVWIADVILFGIGLLFLRQARADARLFEADFYAVVLDKIGRRFNKKKLSTAQAA
jgi:lipopolysaccharide export system permease protein